MCYGETTSAFAELRYVDTALLRQARLRQSPDREGAGVRNPLAHARGSVSFRSDRGRTAPDTRYGATSRVEFAGACYHPPSSSMTVTRQV